MTWKTCLADPFSPSPICSMGLQTQVSLYLIPLPICSLSYTHNYFPFGLKRYWHRLFILWGLPDRDNPSSHVHTNGRDRSLNMLVITRVQHRYLKKKYKVKKNRSKIWSGREEAPGCGDSNRITMLPPSASPHTRSETWKHFWNWTCVCVFYRYDNIYGLIRVTRHEDSLPRRACDIWFPYR